MTENLIWADDKAEGQRRNDGCVQSLVLITELSQGFCMQVKKQQLELDLEQQTGSKLGKEYIKATYGHPGYLTYMQSTSWETLGCRKHKLESRLLGEI